MKNSFNRFFCCETCQSVLLAGFVTLLAYAPFLNRLGYYQEDLYNIWSGITQGPASFIPLFAADRPFIGYHFYVLYPILGSNPLSWQIYGLLLRLVTVFALFWVLRLIWPEKRPQTTAVTLLFAVYPGFLQQPQAHTFQIALEAIACATLSIGLTIVSARQKNLFRAALFASAAILLQLIYILDGEYFIGLEVLRVAMLWYSQQQRQPQALRQSLVRTFKWTLPYVFSAGAFLFWRLFIYNSTRPTTNVDRLFGFYSGNLLHMILRIGIETGKDILESVALAWGVPLYNYLYYGSYQDAAVALLVTILGAGALLLYYRLLRWSGRPTSNFVEDTPTYKAWIWIGLIGIVFGLLPSILANRNVHFEDRFDRYAYPASIGVALFLVGVIYTVLRPKLRIWAVLSLVCLALLTHFYNSLFMSDYWAIQKQVWWQLSWRAPGLEPGTTLFVTLPKGFAFAEGYEAWAPASLIYYRESGPAKIAGEVLNQRTKFDIYRGGLRVKSHRSVEVNRDFDKPLILSQPDRTACLHVLDGKKYELSENEDPLVSLVAPYSRTDLILADASPKTPPSDVFGPEPEHGWCYYYQKAMLARQVGDWQEIANLGDEVKQKKLGPVHKVEWMPFLEGYASTGREKDAKNLAAIIKVDSGARNLVCDQLQNRPDYPATYAYEKVVEFLCTYAQ